MTLGLFRRAPTIRETRFSLGNDGFIALEIDAP
jgi:hypothetical protein